MVPASGHQLCGIRAARPACRPVPGPKPGAARLAGAARRADRRASLLGLLFAASWVTACVQPTAPPKPGEVAPEIYELANIRPSNVVPKASPSNLVNTFETFCLDGSHDPARIAERLRSASFVPLPKEVPGWPSLAQQTNVTAFAVDDNRPLVMLSDDGQTCAVGAESRTGQTARIQEMIAQRFPSAQALDPQTVSSGTETAFLVQGSASGVIFVQRIAPSISNSRLILGIIRDQ